jgi:MFS family permease
MLFAARIVDGLSGGNITTARAYLGDIATEENRAKSFGMLGAAFGLGFIIGPGLGGLFARISYTAPIWAAAAITVGATLLAWLWLPETVHRVNAVSGSPWLALRELRPRRPEAVVLIDFLLGLFAKIKRRFLFGARRRPTRRTRLPARGVWLSRRPRAVGTRRPGGSGSASGARSRPA